MLSIIGNLGWRGNGTLAGSWYCSGLVCLYSSTFGISIGIGLGVGIDIIIFYIVWVYLRTSPTTTISIFENSCLKLCLAPICLEKFVIVLGIFKLVSAVVVVVDPYLIAGQYSLSPENCRWFNF